MLAAPLTYADGIQCFNVKLEEFDACKVIFPGCDSLHRCNQQGRWRRWAHVLPQSSASHGATGGLITIPPRISGRKDNDTSSKKCRCNSTESSITPADSNTPLLSPAVLTHL